MQQARRAVAALERIRSSPVVHDETGWRENGRLRLDLRTSTDGTSCAGAPEVLGEFRRDSDFYAMHRLLEAAVLSVADQVLSTDGSTKAVGWAAAGGCSLREQALERRRLDCAALSICRRIERHIKSCSLVSHPETRQNSLRHLVISRKISGGTRSEAGSDSKMTLASLFGTWRARGLNPLRRRLLISPQL